LNVQNNFFSANPLFNPNPPFQSQTLLTNPYNTHQVPIQSNNNNTNENIQPQPPSQSNYPNNLTISLANLQNNRNFNPYSLQNMLIGEFSEEFIREMQKAREITDKKYANLSKPNRPCWYVLITFINKILVLILVLYLVIAEKSHN
jgi:hypothetical protein